MDGWFEDSRTEVDEGAASDLDVKLESVAIARMIEEVRAEETGVPRSYNRTFNRHNR
ncbi:YhhA family cyclophane-containing RiPP [Sphingomonas sp.]|jgi:hypothetical protein|uniref:YhhA family cyclophane-containing RiPP n=1 Tax=Sphingomonas sp. TaxID=28214 RepID=UPI002ED8F3AA